MLFIQQDPNVADGCCTGAVHEATINCMIFILHVLLGYLHNIELKVVFQDMLETQISSRPTRLCMCDFRVASTKA